MSEYQLYCFAQSGNSYRVALMLNLIRASSHPFPGAYGITRTGEKVTIWRAARYDGPVDPLWAEAPVGTVLAAEMESALIKCPDGLLLATEVSPWREQLSGARFG